MNTVAVSLSQPIGSTNIGVIPKIFLNNEIQLASETYVAEKDLGEALEKYEKNVDKSKRRRNGKYMGHKEEEEEMGNSRSDSLTEAQSREQIRVNNISSGIVLFYH